MRARYESGGSGKIRGAVARSFLGAVLVFGLTPWPSSVQAQSKAWADSEQSVTPSAASVAPSTTLTTDESSSALASSLDQWSAASAAAQEPSYSPYSYVADDANASPLEGAAALAQSDGAADNANESLPSTYDLRDLGVVTPVKDQMPWGTCWGFAAIAASETSILSEMGATYEETGLDLSERAFAWLAYEAVPESEGSQAGEGPHYAGSDTSPNARLITGGYAAYATTLFSSGTGLLPEDEVPYRNGEGKIFCRVKTADASLSMFLTITLEEIAAYEAAGATVTKEYYTDEILEVDTRTGEVIGSAPATWKVSDEYWGVSSYELEGSNILPEYRILDWSGSYTGTSEEAIAATKSELMAGRAVAVGYAADISVPGEISNEQYIDVDHWAHYTYETVDYDHMVTIVGWDDSYSKENFGSGDADKQPPADGAWIVKNSWGAQTEDFPNYANWGIVNDEGKSTGYFYLSYYDQSISNPESFDFDLNSYSESGEYYTYQYDYLPSSVDPVTLAYDAPAPEANVFEADDNCVVRSFSCQTTRPNIQVTYEMYLLNDSAASPTDGALVARASDTYEYGGFHRTTLDEGSRVSVPKGQRFSVVVTQYCLDDGKYYQSAAMNYAFYPDETVEAFRASMTEYYESSYYTEKHNSALEDYLAQGLSEEEAEAKATEDANAYMELESTKAEIAQAVETSVDRATAWQFESVVNKGESYSYNAADKSSENAWVDWSTVVEFLETSSTENEIYDNFPIKAYADVDAAGAIERVAGEEAVDTAVDVAAAGFTSADAVVIAQSGDYADAMSAAGLAGLFGAPILLVDAQTGLSESTIAEIRTLGATTAYVIGGPNAIKADVAAQLKDAGITNITDDGSDGSASAWRLWGTEASDTSMVCANRIVALGGSADYAVVAMSDNFQDALSMSSFAYAYKVPVVLETSADNAAARALPSGALELLNAAKTKVYVAGGTAAVSEESLAGVHTDIVRLAGNDGYDTSNQIARYMVNAGLLKANLVCVACGASKPAGADALSGAALAGKYSGVILLANANEAMDDEGVVSTVTLQGHDSQGGQAFLEAHAAEVGKVFVLGGTTVMPEEVISLIDAVLSNKTGCLEIRVFG